MKYHLLFIIIIIFILIKKNKYYSIMLKKHFYTFYNIKIFKLTWFQVIKFSKIYKFIKKLI